MRTMIATPEDNWRRVYGVIRPGQLHPLMDYDDFWEALAVAKALGGTTVVRWETRTDWEAV